MNTREELKRLVESYARSNKAVAVFEVNSPELDVLSTLDHKMMMSQRKDVGTMIDLVYDEAECVRNMRAYLHGIRNRMYEGGSGPEGLKEIDELLKPPFGE